MPIYATWNPNDKHPDLILSNNNKTITKPDTFAYQNIRTTIPLSGKQYFEISIDTGVTWIFFGIASKNVGLANWTGSEPDCWLHSDRGYKYNNGVATNTGLWAYEGDVVRFAVDIPNNSWWYGVNNTWAESGNPNNGINPLFDNLTGELYVILNILAANVVLTINPGDSAFVYSVPNDFQNGYYEFIAIKKEWILRHRVGDIIYNNWILKNNFNSETRWILKNDIAELLNQEWVLSHDILQSIGQEWILKNNISDFITYDWIVRHNILNTPGQPGSGFIFGDFYFDKDA